MHPEFTSYWNTKKEKLKLKYENLSDKDLDFREGKEKEMMKIVSNKIGKTEKELLTIIVTI
ncbi:MAG: general stress protein CsbD [Bacteroidales bacterium]|nr:general stress protein CsbD [Bacteroidales bacterium]MBK8884116.1 general stress protein CsbD [Bacteroidales bacterium]